MHLSTFNNMKYFHTNISVTTWMGVCKCKERSGQKCTLISSGISASVVGGGESSNKTHSSFFSIALEVCQLDIFKGSAREIKIQTQFPGSSWFHYTYLVISLVWKHEQTRWKIISSLLLCFILLTFLVMGIVFMNKMPKYPG